MPTKFAAALALAGLLTLAGCQAEPPWPEPERSAAEAAGLGSAIAFRSEGSPIDEAESAPDELTLAEAIRRALTTHPEIQAAIARVRVAQAEAHQERLLPNPVLSVALRFVEAGGPGNPVIEASLSAELLSLLQKPGKVRAADHRMRAAAAEVITVALDVLAQVQERYAGIQARDAQTAALDERRGLTGRLLRLADSRLQAGEGTRLDVTTLRAQEAELAIEAVTLEQERRELRLELARLIGEPSSAAAWRLSPWTPAPPATLEERAWIAAALEHRPEIQAKIWELAALGVESRLARWILNEGEAGAEAERDDGEWSVGPAVSVPLPIFDWGQARRRLAEARLLEAVHQLVQVKREAIEEVRRALAAHTASAEAARRVREELLPLLEQRTREAEAVYRAGHDDILLALLAEHELRTGRTRLIDLDHRAAEASIRLQRAVGGPPHAPSALTQPLRTNP